MATYTSAKALARAQQKRAQLLHRVMDQVTQKEMERLVRRLQKRGEQLLSGNLSTANLAELGHPYKRTRRRYTERQRITRAFVGSVRLLPINTQTGKLKTGLRVYVRKVGNQHGIYIQDEVPYALYQLDPDNKGTKNMRPRGFWKALQKSYAAYDRQQIRSALLKAKRATEKARAL